MKASYEDWSARSHLWITVAPAGAWYLHVLAPYCSIVSKMTFFKHMKNVKCRIWLSAESLMIQGMPIADLFMWDFFLTKATWMDLPFGSAQAGTENRFVPSSSPNLFHASWMSSCLIWMAAWLRCWCRLIWCKALCYRPCLEDIDINHCRDFPQSDIDFPLIQKRDEGGTSHPEGHSSSAWRHVQYRRKWILDFMQCHCNIKNDQKRVIPA